MDFIEALQKGTVRGIEEKPEKHIETVLSDVFLYANKVRKVYKHRKGIFFGDLSDPYYRKTFYIEDFSWNQKCSPEIHNALRGVRKNKDTEWELYNIDNADDYFIEMERVDESDTLIRRLLEGKAQKENVIELTHNLAQSTQDLTHGHKHKLEHVYAREWSDIMRERLEDLREWGYMAKHVIPRKITDSYIQHFIEFVEAHSYFKSVDTSDYTLTVDNHAANVVFIPGDRPRFIDIYLSKEMWRVVDTSLNISRIAACVKALGSEDLGSIMYETYTSYHKLAPREVCDFYECYCALIKMYYFIHLDQPEISRKYKAFAEKKINSLQFNKT